MTTANPKQTGAVPVSRFVTFIAITVIGCLIDLYTKFAMLAWRGMEGEKPDYWIIENYVGIQVALNEGALFGMGKGYGMVFAGLSVVALIGIGYWLFYRRAAQSWFLTISLASVAAGILGNLYDRLGMWTPPGQPDQYRDEVRDWILLRWGEYTWPNFNIADCLLVCGAAMLMIYALLARDPEGPAKDGARTSKSGDKSENATATGEKTADASQGSVKMQRDANNKRQLPRKSAKSKRIRKTA